MAKKAKKIKVIRYENGITYLENPEDSAKPKRKFSDEARQKLSIARRARVKQPRDGTSKKCQNLYEQIVADYLGKDSKLTSKQKLEIEEFLQKKKNELKITKEETQELGIHTDYHLQKISFHEIRVESMLFDVNGEITNEFEKDSDIAMDNANSGDNSSSNPEFDEVIGRDFDE